METGIVGEFAERVRANVGCAFIGKADVIDLVLVAILCEGHLLIEDVPGIGKTTLAKSVAASLGCTFARIQCTPDLLPSDITGISVFDQRTQAFVFREGPVSAQVVLADEVNRATPRTQAALLEAMQERQVTVDGQTHPLPRPFLVFATQNPIELEGTFPLPEAQVDRFLICLSLGYPTLDQEDSLLLRFREGDPLEHLGAVTMPGEVLSLQREVTAVRVEASVRAYVVGIARATRAHEDVQLGVSPRGTLALYKCAQALAAIRGRDYVLPDDVKWLAPYVMTHRMIISPATRLRGRRASDVLMDVIETVPVPVEDL
jgi:MoxR-like ATPase